MDKSPTHAWQCIYPALACHAHGWLEVGDGHQVYWEECGNPSGQPALFVHGGPGAGCTPEDRRWFDPQRYRIVLFDQRGAGRSRPLGELNANTTAHLLHDMQALRRHLHIERWLLFGGSWGATLALAYAQLQREDVHALVLRGVFTATRAEQRALYGTKRQAMLQTLSLDLDAGDATQARQAAQRWWRWEQDLMDSEDGSAPAMPPPEEALMAMARIGVHYALNDYFLDERQLLDHATRLGQLPGIIVQGRRDLVTPAAAALALHQAWPQSQLRLLPHAGHASSHPDMAQHLIHATDTLAGKRIGQTQHLPTPQENDDE